jgi:protein involved in temperature-dependent protein secretion
MADNLSGIGDAIRRASESFAEAVTTVSKSIQNVSKGGGDRERAIENWLRIARMSKDGVITAMEHGFEVWEREMRRATSAGGGSAPKAPSNPMEAWAENLRTATDALLGGAGDFGEEARKQTESVRKSVADGIQAWQRLWEPEKK